MNLLRMRVVFLPVLVAGTFLTLLLLGFTIAAANAAHSDQTQKSTLNRAEDPVIVTGSDMPFFLGTPIRDVVLYAYSAESWSAIPFQIDERIDDSTGTYVQFEDGLLDENDELVFMAKDAGQAADQAWPDDEEAKSNPRYEIAATDPLTGGGQGWAYLFQSTTLITTPVSYVEWNQALQKATAISYTAAFSPSAFVGLADLTVNGNGIDILDRQKTRVEALIFTFDEEDLIAFIDPTIAISVVGSVRGVVNGGQLNLAIYGARMDLGVALDTTAIPLDIDDIRASFDLNDPAQTGITNYYDSNGSDFLIDGSPDAVAASPPFDWYQSSGASGGLVVTVPEVEAGTALISNYYKDDDTYDPGDAGDGLSYADSGLHISDPGSTVRFNLAIFTLPPGSTANVGAAYFERVTTPLSVKSDLQFFEGGNIYLPTLFKPA